MPSLIETVFSLSNDIRYVAVYRDGELSTASKPGLIGESSAESDKYEEIIVNPTLLTLLRQRGNIDCGGIEFVLIRYGNFYQSIYPLSNGHLSVGIEPDADPLTVVERVRRLLKSIETL